MQCCSRLPHCGRDTIGSDRRRKITRRELEDALSMFVVSDDDCNRRDEEGYLTRSFDGSDDFHMKEEMVKMGNKHTDRSDLLSSFAFVRIKS